MTSDPIPLPLRSSADVEQAVQQPGLSYAAVVATVLDGYAKRPALGVRGYDVETESPGGRKTRSYRSKFETISYEELHTRIKGLAHSLRHGSLKDVTQGDLVVIFGFNGVDFATADLACAYAGLVSVPLQSAIRRADLEQVIADISPAVIVATAGDLVLAAELAVDLPSVRAIVAMDHDDRLDDDRECLAAARVTLDGADRSTPTYLMSEMIQSGVGQVWTAERASGEGDNRIAALIHSSGSTGTPKGVVVSERVAKTPFRSTPPGRPVVRLSVAPMNHSAGRTSVYSTLAAGGTAYFTTKADLSLMFEDMQIVRPTDIFLFPRVLEMIYQSFKNEVARRSGGQLSVEDDVAEQVRSEMRTGVLGERLAAIRVGSAPTSAAVKEFVSSCFNVPVEDSYGMSECGAISVNNRVMRPPIVDYRLRDVPELGYFTTDKPYPRGELCIKTSTDVPGYFKRPEATAALFDVDGYVLTGDVVEERGLDHIVYVDRRNGVLKLSQGEFVSTGSLAPIFEARSPFIQQMYLYGNPERSYLLAVIVPNVEAVEGALGSMPEELELKTLIRNELNATATATGMKSFQVPRDFLLETEPFSSGNGLLTSLGKHIRPALHRKYGEALESLYAAFEDRQDQELQQLRNRSDLSVRDKIGKALEVVLGVGEVDPSAPYTFSEMGGDSLGATTLSSLLEDVFGVVVPVSAILSPTGTPSRWAEIIDGSGSDRMSQPALESIHPGPEGRLRASELSIRHFIGDDAVAPRSITQEVEPKAVVLTGATGFLGKFLCLEWLETLAGRDGRLVCIVRAPDDETARSRLDRAFEGSDKALEHRYHELASDHLEVLAGDIGDPHLGLEMNHFSRMASTADRIVHAGALVNHLLSYNDLFIPNVVGTAEIVRLALTGKPKVLDYVSSSVTTQLMPKGRPRTERTPLPAEIELDGAYAAGYRASKWAAEQLLDSAHSVFGLPVNIFRCTMILPHRQYGGQANVSDVLMRLLYSVIATGLAPESFYELDGDMGQASPHYDGLPVDVVASAIVGISGEPHTGVRRFHVSNPHTDDGVSLDTFVTWMRDAGYRIESVAMYEEWVRLFQHRLEALPDTQRQRSSLALMDSMRLPSRPGRSFLDSREFLDSVARIPEGPTIPNLTPDYLRKCLRDLDEPGFTEDRPGEGESSRQGYTR